MKLLIGIILVAFTTTSAFDLRKSQGTDVPTIRPEGRITNGEYAIAGQFPYQVGLLIRHKNSNDTWCGGSLISNQWILTAAHSMTGMINVTVYLGATRRKSAEVTHTITRNDIIVHSGWKPKIKRNDIAVIKIPASDLSANIQPVKLPALASYNSNYAGDKAIATGWGRVSDSARDLTNNLQWGRMDIITNDECTKIYSVAIKPTNICISTKGGVSTCKGDSGGPLVLESSKVLVGLNSFGARVGCQKGLPTVFTRISSYLEWIKVHTGIYY